jgi:hypothetical protein
MKNGILFFLIIMMLNACSGGSDSGSASINNSLKFPSTLHNVKVAYNENTGPVDGNEDSIITHDIGPYELTP